MRAGAIAVALAGAQALAAGRPASLAGLAETARGALGERGADAAGWLLVAVVAVAVAWLSLPRLAALAARLIIALTGGDELSRVRGGREGLVGERGVARTALGPGLGPGLDARGKVFVHGELWTAVADAPVAAAAPVEVVEVEGLTLRVRPITQHEEPPVGG